MSQLYDAGGPSILWPTREKIGVSAMPDLQRLELSSRTGSHGL